MVSAGLMTNSSTEVQPNLPLRSESRARRYWRKIVHRHGHGSLIRRQWTGR
jgi:hypothetical protein